MDSERVDARGLPCPQPVIMTREMIGRTDVSTVSVLVDDMAQVENVISMARNQGWTGKITAQDQGCFEVTLSRGDPTSAEVTAQDAACGTPTNLVVLVSSDRFGEGDDRLGAILVRAFIKTLWEAAPRPASLIFVNGGVKLTTAGSELIDDIKRLEEGGTAVLSCGTCLDFFNLKDKLLVGSISNMFEIVSRLAAAERVVRP